MKVGHTLTVGLVVRSDIVQKGVRELRGARCGTYDELRVGISTRKRARNHHAFHTEVRAASVVLGAFGGGREDGTR
jgi:hypothetical protein